MIDADRAPSETMREILTDIRTQSVQAAQIIERHRTMLRSHELLREPIDVHAVVQESLALGVPRPEDARDRGRRRPVPGSLRRQRRSRAPAAGAGEPDDERDRRHGRTPRPGAPSTITSIVRPADVELSVRDAGTGLPPHLDGSLFTPFVTTKPNGLGIGLTIARTIVDAHGRRHRGPQQPGRGCDRHHHPASQQGTPDSLSAPTGAA